MTAFSIITKTNAPEQNPNMNQLNRIVSPLYPRSCERLFKEYDRKKEPPDDTDIKPE